MVFPKAAKYLFKKALDDRDEYYKEAAALAAQSKRPVKKESIDDDSNDHSADLFVTRKRKAGVDNISDAKKPPAKTDSIVDFIANHIKVKSPSVHNCEERWKQVAKESILISL